MSASIAPITATGVSIAAPKPAASSPAPAGFSQSLSSLLDGVDQADGAANAAVGNMIAGTGDVPEAMVALQRAEVALELTVQVRNKLVQAYQEIMRMPV